MGILASRARTKSQDSGSFPGIERAGHRVAALAEARDQAVEEIHHAPFDGGDPRLQHQLQRRVQPPQRAQVETPFLELERRVREAEIVGEVVAAVHHGLPPDVHGVDRSQHPA